MRVGRQLPGRVTSWATSYLGEVTSFQAGSSAVRAGHELLRCFTSYEDGSPDDRKVTSFWVTRAGLWPGGATSTYDGGSQAERGQVTSYRYSSQSDRVGP
jgi:hypothetical protein